MGKKKAKKKSTAENNPGGAQFDTKIYRDVPNNDVFDFLAQIQHKPEYVSHTVVPQGNGKCTIVVVLEI